MLSITFPKHVLLEHFILKSSLSASLILPNMTGISASFSASLTNIALDVGLASVSLNQET